MATKIQKENKEVKTVKKEPKVKVVKETKKSTEAASAPVATKEQANLKVKVLGKDGKEVGNLTLPEKIFGAKVNKVLLAQAVRVYLANQRAGSASTKTRGEVRGSTRKIYRQKGTGRARHGAITAPIFVGGGITFGPRPRDYSLKLNQKMKHAALASALSMQLKNNGIVVVDGIVEKEPKTKQFAAMLTALQLVDKSKKAKKVLFVMPEKIDAVVKSSRNIGGLDVRYAQNLNAYEVLTHNYVLFMKDAVGVLEKVI